MLWIDSNHGSVLLVIVSIISLMLQKERRELLEQIRKEGDDESKHSESKQGKNANLNYFFCHNFLCFITIAIISEIFTTSTDSFKAWDAPGFVAYHEPTTTDILERKRTDDQKRAEARAQFRG